MSDELILLVEDNADDEALTMRAFGKNRLHAKIEVVRDGPEALDYLFCQGPFSNRDPFRVPRVVLLDINLPKLSGLEVLRRLRKDPRTKLLPIVILTSSNEEEDLLNGYQLGVNSYIRKPVDYNAFMEAVKQLGVYWLSLNQCVPVNAKR
ncbi:MAG: response regulator [Acidobacteriota bacterium]|nr:response regulator [Acidobacteriota bacterium]